MKTVQTDQPRRELSYWHLSRRRAVERSSVIVATQSVSGLRRVLYLLSAGGFFVLAIHHKTERQESRQDNCKFQASQH